MNWNPKAVRVLYSFPIKLGGGRVGCTSWQQVAGLAAAGAKVLAFPGVIQTPVSPAVKVWPTLSRGRARISYRLVGRLRSYALHDWIVARRLPKLAGQIDVIHTWPLAALRTLKKAAELGIPTVYERPNSNTRYFYEVVRKECEELRLTLPPKHEHQWNDQVLRLEEQEYELATRLLCPSEHVAQTFLDRGYPRHKLARHHYGFDPAEFHPRNESRSADQPFTMLFAGGVSPVKGLHYALPAWLKSPASKNGCFMIAGTGTPEYLRLLAPYLSDPSIKMLGQRADIPELMRRSDILVLPSLSEGFSLTVAEAIGSGCVPLVSDRITDACFHMHNALVHPIGDVNVLAAHITMIYQNHGLLAQLRAGCLEMAPQLTWTAAGTRLLEIYKEVLAEFPSHTRVHPELFDNKLRFATSPSFSERQFDGNPAEKLSNR